MSSESKIPEHDIIGIKFGSSLTVLGTLNNRVVDVLYSDTSSREIPSLILFTKEYRKYAEHAQSIYLKNITNSYNFLNRLIGLKEENEEIIKHEKKYIYVSINEDFTFGEEKLNIESIIASFLYFLSKTWKNKINNKKTNNIVISIPDYYTQYQRLILLNSIEIANLKCISLLKMML
jgi:molecular chaperone DnaK (HSP70)